MKQANSIKLERKIIGKEHTGNLGSHDISKPLNSRNR